MYDAQQEDRFRGNWAQFLRRHGKLDWEARILEALVNNYGGQDRHYRTFWHINSCLDLLRAAREDVPVWFTDPLEDAAIELALIEHDVISDAGVSSDNEARSSALAGIHAIRLDFTQPVAIETKKCVLATRHRLGHSTRLCRQIVADIDLATIAAPWEQFLEQGRLLRREALHIESDEEAARIQCDFLVGLIDQTKRPSIFQTDYFKARFERPAYENIVRFGKLYR